MNNTGNIVCFPSTRYSAHTAHDSMPATRKISGHMTKTVYPIKDISQIHALHRYLLSQAQNATSPSKARNAYRNWFFFALGINLGFRGGDITELTWDKLVNYDPITQRYTIRKDEQNFIHAEKTGKATYVILNAEAERYIHFYLKATKPLGIIPMPNTPVFPSNKKAGTSEATVAGHIDCDNIGRIIKKAAKEVGITQSICTHSLRKTFGYHYYRNTGDIITLQKIFGHSSPAITLTYIGLEAEELINAYSSKPDTSIDDLENYSCQTTVTEEHPHPIQSDCPHTPKLKIIQSTSPIIQYSPHRYYHSGMPHVSEHALGN